jgi:hypothetical protein
MVREVDSPEGKRKATRAEVKLFKGWVDDRTARGLPPWVTSPDAYAAGMSTNATVLKSSRTLRQWADEYWQVLVSALPHSVSYFFQVRVRSI